MKWTHLAIMAAAALLVASCDDSPSSSSSSSSRRSDMVGSWKDNKSGITTQFVNDGTLLMTPPGAQGKWSMLSDEQLKFALERNGLTVMSQVLKLRWVDTNHLVLTDQDGKEMQWTRL